MNKPFELLSMDREHWQQRLTGLEKHLGYKHGFKLLFSPWRLLGTAHTLFLSLNPGGDPSDGKEPLRIASDERGCSYTIPGMNHKPIAHQYVRLCELIGQDPEDVLAATLMPFRTDDWDRKRDEVNIAITRDFWSLVVNNGRIKKVIAVSDTVEKEILKLTGARLQAEIPANWAKVKIRRYRNNDGLTVYALPHLSRFKLLSRNESIQQLIKLFELDQN
ncbi:hypothetical protein [Ruegeria atlantica]|uniref:Uncharacterized protein n=1 Tax=Ruegeria atlantica TaxID=81569 RepID=A0A0P1EAM0_9RHOB|nr:hypothetical protein [Ruegeria atlantica]CUH46405.1 hypothetical protein RUA4292_00571 [Ruegeria atlantica]